MFSKRHKTSHKSGLTIVELLTTMGLVAVLASMAMVNYNNFGRTVRLENTAYEVALTIRQAQFFGINRSERYGTSTDDPRAYGIFFDLDGGTVGMSDEAFMMFVDDDITQNRIYDDSGSGGFCVENGADECVDIFTFTDNVEISEICVGSSEATCSILVPEIHISFQRPDPDAAIKTNAVTQYSYTMITLRDKVNGATQQIAVGAAGQISIK